VGVVEDGEDVRAVGGVAAAADDETEVAGARDGLIGMFIGREQNGEGLRLLPEKSSVCF
jgi:hypothetical protein